jgi:predicted aspartyl protease
MRSSPRWFVIPRAAGVVCAILVEAFCSVDVPPAQAAETDDVRAVLAANRAAVALPASGTLTLNYAYTIAGMTGTRTSIVDLASGAFVDSDAVGPFAQGFGYDGVIPWMRDLSGAHTPQQGGDRLQTTVNDAYRRSNAWWRDDLGGAQIVYAGRESEADVELDHLVVTPKGGKPFDAWFDVKTHFLMRVAEPRQFFKTRAFYSDFRPHAGAVLPHQVTLDGGVGEAHYETLQLERAAHGLALPRAAYARPAQPPTGMEIVGAAASATVPFRFLNNHIYVSAHVNGEGPYTFIVDTGGHSVLSPKAAQEAGVMSFGTAATSGVGEKVETSGIAKVGEITLGAVRLQDQTVIVNSVYDPSIEGIAVDGMVGFELFRRFAVRIDYGARTLTFTRFDRFEPPAGETEIPFVFYDHLPSVEGFVDDLPARFDIDTGSRMEVDLTSPFVERAKLRERYGKGVAMITGWGTGGASRSSVVRLPSLTLGSVRIERVAAGLSDARYGSISDPNYEGNIGSGLLRRFVVTFDYSRQRMYLQPLVPPPADAGQFDRSGIWINAEPDGYRIMSVATGSPAAEAGMAEGDLITEFDGKPARVADLPAVRAMLRERPPGSKVTLEVRRGDALRTATLTLRDQI